MRIVHLILVVLGYLLLIDSKESNKVRSKRGKVTRASSNKIKSDVKQHLDAIDPTDAESMPLGIQTNFLSESVRRYLELGRAIPGRPGTDYPILHSVPYTQFYCDEQKYPGFFADTDTRCQAWHYCDIDGRQASFLCPNGTVFSQAVFCCDWWFNVRCELSPLLYEINSRLYQKPKVNPTQPHRQITKELIENIFN